MQMDNLFLYLPKKKSVCVGGIDLLLMETWQPPLAQALTTFAV